MSSFWSGWIILLTTITIVATTWLLMANRYRSGDQETTGHVFDGIEEYDNPLPSWWLWGFLFTIVFGIIYLVFYPGMGNFRGVLGWTEINQYEDAVDKANEKYGPVYQRMAAMNIEDLAQDEDAMRMGRRLFSDNCAQCHGADARGGKGYPNLTDDSWQWGGEPDQIKATLTNGRQAAMPSWQASLGDRGIREVTEYILSINGKKAEPTMAEAGGKVFATYCAACHNADASGNPMLGGPALNDAVWLYGGSREQIRETLIHGRNGMMPAQKDTLYPEKIHLLAAYVYSLSH